MSLLLPACLAFVQVQDSLSQLRWSRVLDFQRLQYLLDDFLSFSEGIRRWNEHASYGEQLWCHHEHC